MYKIGVKVLKTYHSACDEHEDYYSKINLKTYQLDISYMYWKFWKTARFDDDIKNITLVLNPIITTYVGLMTFL